MCFSDGDAYISVYRSCRRCHSPRRSGFSPHPPPPPPLPPVPPERSARCSTCAAHRSRERSCSSASAPSALRSPAGRGAPSPTDASPSSGNFPIPLSVSLEHLWLMRGRHSHSHGPWVREIWCYRSLLSTLVFNVDWLCGITDLYPSTLWSRKGVLCGACLEPWRFHTKGGLEHDLCMKVRQIRDGWRWIMVTELMDALMLNSLL
jgi:hypothetical protein